MNHYLSNRLNDRGVVTGTFCKRRVQLLTHSLTLLVATAGMIGFTRAAEELPSQEQALARALENHPDIVAAKAKVALVEAELYGKRMEVSRQVLGLYGSLKALDAEIAGAKASLLESTGSVAIDRHTAERKIVQATAQREQAEKELRLLIGEAPGAKEAKSSKAKAIPTRQPPQGHIVSIWKAKAEGPIKISFTDQPLLDVLGYLSDKTGIKFSLQQRALEEAGLGADMPITLSTNEVPLAAAMQAFEDSFPQLQFVLRDYGVLVTTEESVEEHGYMPVLEIGKEVPEVKSR